VVKALDLGALGFIPKSGQREVMLSALQLVFAGGIYNIGTSGIGSCAFAYSCYFTFIKSNVTIVDHLPVTNVDGAAFYYYWF